MMMKKTAILISIFLALTVILAVEEIAHAEVKYQSSGTSTAGPTATQKTPLPTATVTQTPSATPTTTLAPLPALTLIFPALTATDTATSTPESIQTTETPIPTDGASILATPPRLRLLIIFMVFLWIFLVGFAIIYIRQIR